MENRSVLILPTSIDSRRAYYTIPGNYKYLTNKIRLTDFKIKNEGSKPIYFGSKGVYQLIKNISFIDKTGVVIDTLNSDYIAIKLLSAPNSTQRDINRNMFQSQCVSINTLSMGQKQLTEIPQQQDATKLSGYIDLSFLSNYLQARKISDDFLQIVIEFIDTLDIDGGYSFSVNPSLYVEEVLSAEPVDSNDVIVYDMIVPDKLVLKPENTDLTLETDLKYTEYETRMNSYNNQLISNLYFYIAKSINGKIFDAGLNDRNAQEQEFNVLLDGLQLKPFGGLTTDAQRLASFVDNHGDMCLPDISSYYANIRSVFHDKNAKVALYNPNTNQNYDNMLSYTCLGINKQINSEIVIQYKGKFRGTTLNEPVFLQILAEVKRYYKRSTGFTGNYILQQTV